MNSGRTVIKASGAKGVAKVVVWLAMNCLVAFGAPEVLLLQSIRLEGSNVVLRAQVPPGVKSITVQSKGLAAEDIWQDCLVQSVEGAATELTLLVPKPAAMQIFRLRAELDQSELTGAEVRYVAVPALRSTEGKNSAVATNSACKELVLHFKGEIDGSDCIRLNHAGAIWEHVNWAWPGAAISINGIEWKPAEKNLFAPAGNAQLIPAEIGFTSARLEVLEGRDTIALEPGTDGLVVYVNDTPNGPALYDFKVYLSNVPVGRSPVHKPAAAKLIIKASIDGSDRLVINADGASWEHKFWRWPNHVSLNGITWDPQKNPYLANEGETRFLPANVDFSTARILSRSGRDLVSIEPQPDALVIQLADNPLGSGEYEVSVGFGAEARRPASDRGQ